MHVSLLGQTEEREKPAPPPASTKSELSRADAEKMLRLIEVVVSARDRTKAVEAIAAQIATHFPGAIVRVGLGGKSLKRVYDRNLGWLGAESTIYSDSADRWEALSAPATQAPPNRDDATLVVTIPQEDGSGRCVLWVDGESVTHMPRIWLTTCLHTLRFVFWDRPTRSWLRTPEKLSAGTPAVVFGVVLIAALVALWPVHYRIACTAKVESIQQRIVATPFEATLLESLVRPGDAVRAGDEIVRLDGRPLRLELERINTEIQQVAKEHDVALHSGRIADAQQTELKKKGLQRRRDLLTDRLQQLVVSSPIDGVVVNGDLRRYVGSPLEMGQTLVEIAPLDRMLVEIEIPEHEIGFVEEQAMTSIRIAATGSEPIEANLTLVYPAAEIRGDKNVFIGNVELDNTDRQLRPGMQGKAITYGPTRPRIWSWIRSGWERLLWWSGF